MRPAQIPTLTALLLGGVLIAAASGQTTETRSLLDGRLTIDLPADWVRLTPAELAEHSFGNLTHQDGFKRPDATAGVGIVHHPEPLEDEDPRWIRRALVTGYQTDGWHVEEAGTYLIGDRDYAILHNTMERDGRRFENFVGATALDGRLLQIVFMASGQELESKLMAGQIALGSVIIHEASEGAVGSVPEPLVSRPERAASKAYGTRRDIPGTGVSLMVPDSFRPALNLSGYTGMDGRSILFATISNLPRDLSRHQLDEVGLRQMETTRIEMHAVEIDGHRGDLALLQRAVDGMVRHEWILVLDGGDRSLLAHATYSPDPQGLLKQIMEDALRSVVWDTSQITDPMVDLGIELEETGSLRVVCRAHDRLILAPPGSGLPLNLALPYMVIHPITADRPIDDLAAVASVYATRSPLIDDLVVSSEETRMFGSLPGYVLTGTGVELSSQKSMSYFQAIVVGKHRYCVVQGFGGTTRGVDLSRDFAAITANLQLDPTSP